MVDRSAFLQKFHDRFRKWANLNHPEKTKDEINIIVEDMVRISEEIFDETEMILNGRVVVEIAT